MIEQALQIVREYIDEHIDHSTPNAEYTLFAVWQCSILRNFKCLIATTSPNGMYFELTYDAERGCWYFDAYRKIENREIYP